MRLHPQSPGRDYSMIENAPTLSRLWKRLKDVTSQIQMDPDGFDGIRHKCVRNPRLV